MAPCCPETNHDTVSFQEQVASMFGITKGIAELRLPTC